MAEKKKERKVVSASESSSKKKTTVSAGEKKTTVNAAGKTVKPAKPTGNSSALRVGAIICWLLAIGCELVGFLMYFGKINITFAPTLACIIAVIVVDLIFVIIGSQLWKRANHISPASEKNKVKFFLWNNMGVIACIIAFLPYIILILTDKEHKLDKNTRIIAVIAAVIALLIGGLTSFDYHPISQEQEAAAVQEIGSDTIVYWTPFGHVYHTSQDCQHLNHSDTLVEGKVSEAIDHSRTRLCKTCAARDNISGVATDE